MVSHILLFVVILLNVIVCCSFVVNKDLAKLTLLILFLSRESRAVKRILEKVYII